MTLQGSHGRKPRRSHALDVGPLLKSSEMSKQMRPRGAECTLKDISCMITLQHVSARSQQRVDVVTRLATCLLPCLELALELSDATHASRQPTAMTLKDTDGEEARG